MSESHSAETDGFSSAQTGPDAFPSAQMGSDASPSIQIGSDASPSAQTASASRKNSQMEKASNPFSRQSTSTQELTQMEKASDPFSRQDLYDDGRTIADMSVFDTLGDARPSPPNSSSSRDIREELGDKDSRRALIFGATWAGLSIGLVYIVIFGLIIGLMVLFWH